MIRFIRRLNLFVVFLTGVAYAAPYVNPNEFWLPMMMGLAFPWLLLANLIFIGLWGVSRMKYWWYSAVCILVGWTHVSAIYGTTFWGNSNQEGLGTKLENRSNDTIGTKKSSPSRLRIMTYNISSLMLERYSFKADGYRDLDSFFFRENPDVLCLQEFASEDRVFDNQVKKSAFLQTYPYKTRVGKNAVAIFSKFPVDSTDWLPINKNGGNGCTFVDIVPSPIDFPQQKIRIYTVHLQSNEVSGMADKIAQQGDLESKSTWMTMMRMIMRVRKASKQRVKEVEQIEAHVKTSPYPSVVCGDFNEVPVSYAYHHLSRERVDAFRAKGRGSGTTYLGNIPFLKIDYILADKRLAVLNSMIYKVPYSDHYPTGDDLDLSGIALWQGF